MALTIHNSAGNKVTALYESLINNFLGGQRSQVLSGFNPLPPAVGGKTMTVKAGTAVINGYMAYSDTDIVMTLPTDALGVVQKNINLVLTIDDSVAPTKTGTLGTTAYTVTHTGVNLDFKTTAQATNQLILAVVTYDGSGFVSFGSYNAYQYQLNGAGDIERGVALRTFAMDYATSGLVGNFQFRLGNDTGLPAGYTQFVNPYFITRSASTALEPVKNQVKINVAGLYRVSVNGGHVYASSVVGVPEIVTIKAMINKPLGVPVTGGTRPIGAITEFTLYREKAQAVRRSFTGEGVIYLAQNDILTVEAMIESGLAWAVQSAARIEQASVSIEYLGASQATVW